VTFHLVTGEYPPESGGVGDYTQLVAEALAARGCAVHVWCPAADPSGGPGSVQVHRLPDHFGRASRLVMDEAFATEPGRVLLQYVPNALGGRGTNLSFCLWLRRAGRRHDVRVMFHEPYFYFSLRHPLRNALAIVQRLMAAVLLRTAPVAYASTDSWRPLLVRWAPSHTRLVVLPIPATVARHAEPDEVERWRDLFSEHGRYASVAGHFGTYGDHVASQLRAAIPAILRADRDVRIICLGRLSDAFAEALPAETRARVLGTGALSRRDISAALRACDVVVQPYPDGVTTRRTSVMASLANGCPTVTTSGPLTEAVWGTAAAVALARAGDAAGLAAIVARLLHDPAERSALAERGRQLYDEAFALDRTIDALLLDEPELARA
jgi:glycosyltransferase involved in cell wall biosynthesis